MKNALFYLTFLLATGVWAGDWQFVSNESLLESSAVQDDREKLDSSSSVELEIILPTDFFSPGHTPRSGQIFVLTFYPHSASNYGAKLIRGPPPVLSA
jgi:hypothetical protein